MEPLQVEYFGHSCFRLTWAGQRIVLDPYADGSVPGCPPLRLEAEFVFCSHGHGDHDAAQCVQLAPGAAPKFTVTELETFHDDAGGTLRGRNTVRVFDFGGLRAAHFGDLGCPLTAAETERLRGLDCAMLPVGGYYTIDAAAAGAIAAALRPRLLIPMHYRTETTGYPVLAPLSEALAALRAAGAEARPMAYGESITIR